MQTPQKKSWSALGWCGAAEATGLGFVRFVVINPRVLSANRIDLGFFFVYEFSKFTYAGVMGCGAAELTGLGFVCFVVINPCVL